MSRLPPCPDPPVRNYGNKGSNRLTSDDIRLIRLDASRYNGVSVARKWGITPAHVHHIKTYRVWKHV